MNATVRHLGDTVSVLLPWGAVPFDARIIGFEENGVRVEALERSDDPLVDNEWLVRWKDIVS